MYPDKNALKSNFHVQNEYILICHGQILNEWIQNY